MATLMSLLPITDDVAVLWPTRCHNISSLYPTTSPRPIGKAQRPLETTRILGSLRTILITLLHHHFTTPSIKSKPPKPTSTILTPHSEPQCHHQTSAASTLPTAPSPPPNPPALPLLSSISTVFSPSPLCRTIILILLKCRSRIDGRRSI